MEIFIWGLDGRTGERTECDFNYISGPNCSAEAEYRSDELVSLGHTVWPMGDIFTKNEIENFSL